MKTFLGFTTGIFTGTFIGWFGMAMMMLMSKDLRELCEKWGWNDLAFENEFKDEEG